MHALHLPEFSDRPVAVKVFDFTAALVRPSDYYKEIELLSKLRHEHVVKLVGHATSPDFSKGYLVTELCEGLSVACWLAPSAVVILPASYEPTRVSLCTAQWHALQHGVDQAVLTHGHLLGFDSFEFEPDAVTEDSSVGQRWLLLAREMHALSALVPVSWKTPVAQSPDVLTPGPLTHPVLVIKTGCLVYSFTVEDFAQIDTIYQHALVNLQVLAFPVRLRIALQTYRALFFLHSNNPCVVHGDVKPGNVVCMHRLLIVQCAGGAICSLHLLTSHPPL